MKGGYVYILVNCNNKVLYVGVTANLEKRMYEHRNHIFPGFTAKYKVTKLVYYERYEFIEDAIIREKQLKGKTRAKKDDLVRSSNPGWIDLYESLDPSLRSG
jgi:putative endonuclease